MAGAGGLVSLLLGIPADNKVGTSLVVAVVGVVMILYVMIGGMKGTTWVQIIKAVLLMVGSALIVVLVLAKFGFNLSDLLGTAANNYKAGADALLDDRVARGWRPRATALVSGPAILGHAATRFEAHAI